MAIQSPLYKGGESSVSGTNIIATVTDLSSLMEDNSAAIVDIYSWAVFTFNPEFLTEFSAFNYRQLLVKKSSGTITIENTRVIENNENIGGGGLSIAWSESVNGTNIELFADITGVPASVFRRATVTFIKA